MKIQANWLRTVMVITGILTLAIGCIILAYPGIAVLFLVYLLAFGLILLGIERIIFGIMG